MAKLFDTSYRSFFKMVSTRLAKEQYVRTQCGQRQPTDAVVDALMTLRVNYTMKYFSVPALRTATKSTVQQAFLAALDVQDRVSYVSSYSSAPCGQKATGCGASLDEGNDTQLESMDVVFMSCGHDGTAATFTRHPMVCMCRPRRKGAPCRARGTSSSSGNLTSVG